MKSGSCDCRQDWMQMEKVGLETWSFYQSISHANITNLYFTVSKDANKPALDPRFPHEDAAAKKESCGKHPAQIFTSSILL